MNCLLLLIILFCCNCNGNCGTNNHGRGDSCRMDYNIGNRHNMTRNVENAREDDFDRTNMRRDCDCEVSPGVHSCPTHQPRTQFPYLEVEPRTCGCEEKQNS